MEAKVDNNSFSGFSDSESQSSITSATHLDVETLKLGTDKILKLIPMSFIFTVVPMIFKQMTHSLELSMIVRYCGTSAISRYVFVEPIIFLISIGFTQSLAESTDVFVQRNIAKQQLIAAEIYVAHFFLLAFIWIVLALVIYFAVLEGVIVDDLVGKYLMLRAGVCTISCTFAVSIECFFASENRKFVIISKNVVFCCIYIVSIMMCYVNNEQLGVSMTNAAVAYTVATFCVGIWMFVLIMRIPFEDIEYRGIIKFHFKKLSPIRWKLIAQIFSYFFTSLMVNHQHYLTYLEAALLNRFLIRQEDMKLIQNARLLTYFKVLEFAAIPNEAFRSVFSELISYNIGIKKITRIWEIIKWSVIFSCSISLPVLAVFAYFAPDIVTLFYPVVSYDSTYYFLMKECYESARMAVISQLLEQMSYMTVSLTLQESKVGLATLMELPNLLYACIYMGYLFYEIKDNAPTTMVMALSEVSNFIIGWGFMIYYIIKYKKLFIMNNKNSEHERGDTEAQKALRQTVMEQLLTGIEHHKGGKHKNIAVLFDKQTSLANNENFFSLRDSIVEGSSRRSSASNSHRPSETEGAVNLADIGISVVQ